MLSSIATLTRADLNIVQEHQVLVRTFSVREYIFSMLHIINMCLLLLVLDCSPVIQSNLSLGLLDFKNLVCY